MESLCKPRNTRKDGSNGVTDAIIMVKKRTADGRECRKCLQMTELLKARGVWERVTRIAWAEESDPESEGMQLGREHRIDTAPFFIMRHGGRERVFASTLRFLQEGLGVHTAADDPQLKPDLKGPEELGLP